MSEEVNNVNVSKQTNNLYSTEINKWIRAHYSHGARMFLSFETDSEIGKTSYGTCGTDDLKSRPELETAIK